jgi:hypothetical protein
MSSLLRRSSVAVSLALATLLVWACSDSSSSGGTGNASSSSGKTDPVVDMAECTTQCEQKATGCQAPANVAQQRCASVCGGSVTQSQVSCLMSTSCEDLAELNDNASLESVCPKSGSSGGTSGTSGSGSPGAFGDACKCKADSSEGASELECAGTDICSPGLFCVGTRTQGVDDGKCRGPMCCTSKEDCAEKLGKQSNCASGQKCACSRGDLECVGDKCTCAGGVEASRGLCFPE